MSYTYYTYERSEIMNQEYKDKNNKLENEFSNLSTEDLTFIRETEQRINEHHNPPIYLIAYDKMNE